MVEGIEGAEVEGPRSRRRGQGAEVECLTSRGRGVWFRLGIQLKIFLGIKLRLVWAPAEAKGQVWQKAGALAWGENRDWGWVLGAAKDCNLEAGSGTGIKGVLLN